MGNEFADHLAKTAATSTSSPESADFVATPRSYVKRILKAHLVKRWQEEWDTTEKGRFTFRFLPTVSLDLLEGSPLRNMFLTGRGPFPSFLHYISKLDSPHCICGEVGDPLHYLWACPLTTQYHLPRPAQIHEDLYFKMFLKYPDNLRRVTSLMRWLTANRAFLVPP